MGRWKQPAPEKPPYRVPSMAEIRAIPWNGLKVASVFAGCGGSSLGYRMAGFRIAWANDFVPHAGETYRANMDPATVFSEADIRTVTAERIFAEAGLAAGELDVFDGSPPCQAFSTSGRIAKNWGQEREYSHGATQKNEELFSEYIRLLDGLQPKVFVAENVSGLIKGASKGFFLEILAGLKACGYRVEARLCDAQWLGVPQRRQRVIFVGVRKDLDRQPAHPAPLPYRYLLREALPWIIRAEDISGDSFHPASCDDCCATITASNIDHLHVEAETDISRYAIGAEWEKREPGIWYTHPEGNEKTRRFFNLHRPSLDEPSPTITAMDANPSAASICHPTEKRKFSIAEFKRLMSFPDDFAMSGSYSQQGERMGNAVPPLMMAAIAATVRDRILDGGAVAAAA